MKLVVVLSLCFIGMAYCQIIRPGQAAGEVGVPEFDEIKVESVLTVRGKGSRTGKSASETGKAPETTDGARIVRNVRSSEVREELLQNAIPIVQTLGLRENRRLVRREIMESQRSS